MMSVTAHTDSGPNFRRQGAVIMSIFALIWAFAGSSGFTSSVAAWGIVVAAVIVTAVLVILAVRSQTIRAEARQVVPDWQRRYNIIGIAEGLAILVAIFLLVSTDVPGLIPPVVCLIVGIHFFPLASTFDQQEYRWTAIALCVVGAIGVAMFGPASDEAVRAVVGLGAAIVLWATAIVVARSG